jgi:citrate lyase subunit beta / citryl-CoA lyase
MSKRLALMSVSLRPRRSLLYMPGSNARALEKARSLPADGVILDLEDAVAPDQKALARAQVAAAVKAGGYGGRELIIRINALSTGLGEEDIAAAVSANPHAVLAPKVESAADIIDLCQMLDGYGAAPSLSLWVMIETPRAILDISSIAAAKREAGGARLAGFVMGTNDLAKETRARLTAGRAAFLPMLMQALLAARAHGLDIIDGVYNGLKDLEGFLAECEQGRDLGFDGKTLIHPDQISIANTVFAPSHDEVAFAQKIIAAFSTPEAATLGALQVEGRMVERLHAEMAARTVAIHRAIQELNG